MQTGFARTGKHFAMEHHGVAADLTTMAKGLAGGFPLAAVTGRADIRDGANPIGIAAAHAVLEDENLCERAISLGSRLKQSLAGIRDEVPENL